MQNKCKALEGVKVLDLGRVMSAPLAAALLADMGADVLKIEQPGNGDDSRVFMPKKDGISTYFITFNRGKRGITLNLKTGKDIFLKLVKDADVVIENFRPGVMRKLGLAYEDLKQINPKIIMASISGFGQEGLYSKRAGYDTIGQAMGGVMSITGFDSGGLPTRCGAAVGDVTSGLSAAVGILAALEQREKTGEGQYIDCALTDTAVVCAGGVNEEYFLSGIVPRRKGNTLEGYAPANCFKTADDYLVCCCEDQDDYAALCAILDREDLLKDPNYATNELRVANREALEAAIEDVLQHKDTAYWVEKMLSAGLAAAPILTIADAVADPQVGGARNMYPTVEYTGLGDVRITGGSLHFSETPTCYGKAPSLGENNEEVICGQLGYTKEQFEEFKANGVI